LIRAVIVDDEAPARRRLRRLVEEEPDVVVLSECAGGKAAVRAVTELRPDLLFLDIRMPEMSGLDVLKAIGPDRVPALVLVTALSDHALEAYELRAIDYLVKPFTRARFAETMTRIRRVLSGGASRDDVRRDRDAVFPIRMEGRLILLRQREIVRVDGAGRSIRVHAKGHEHLQRGSLTEAGERLDPRHFMRVHHSHIVNLDRVREVQPHGHGDYRIVLDDGSVVPVSRGHSERLRDRLGI
jgi:two-component system LytT family response regulator